MPVVPVGDSQTFIWITKHENIADNNKADLLAKAGTTENSTEIVHGEQIKCLIKPIYIVKSKMR